MEGMLTFTKLVTLNLSQNYITVVEGLENCLELNSVDLSYNRIASLEDREQLTQLPKLSHLDLRGNLIDDRDSVVPFVTRLPNICSLYLKNNPCIRLISNLRKQLIIASPTLYYFDDRPINPGERRVVEAFEQGGVEAETQVRAELEAEMRAKLRCGYERNKEIEDDSKIERKKQFKAMMAAVKQEKEDVTTQLQEVIMRMKTCDPDSIEYRKLYTQKYELEREVRQDWYQKLKKNKEEVPTGGLGKSALQTSKEFIEDYDRKYQAEMESRRQAVAADRNIAQLAASEEQKEQLYRR